MQTTKRSQIQPGYLIGFMLIIFAFLFIANCDELKGNVYHTPLGNPHAGPLAGYPEGSYAAGDSTANVIQVGSGTPESCTSKAFIETVETATKVNNSETTISFNCGTEPVTITLDRPARIFNNANKVVIDGGHTVALSGGGRTRILYMNTCDGEMGWRGGSYNCNTEPYPDLTVQNLIFADGNSSSEAEAFYKDSGGGAIFVRGNRFKAINCRFFNNVCTKTGPDVGGGAIRVLNFSQIDSDRIYIRNCTFGGRSGYGNKGANGGAISSLFTSWTITNSVLSYNQAKGWGANPAAPTTPGGGSGGAIYNDGRTMTLTISGSLIEENEVKEHGSSIFFVSNNHDGTVNISSSTLHSKGGTWYPNYQGISAHSDTNYSVSGSTID